MRPYFNRKLPQLVDEFEQHKSELKTLRKLLSELEHRQTLGANSLKAKVSEQILILMEGTQSVDDVESETIAPEGQEQATNAQAKPAGDSVSDLVSTITAAQLSGGDAADTLNEIRQRLLDLSRRNALLNYRHPRAKSLRVVDEVPDQLFDRLLSGDAFVFEPLPRVPQEHEAMPDDVREFLEDQKNWRRPSRAEWARLHDIEPGYDLPVAGTRGARHSDLVIQTLLFPDELETRLRTMSAQARTAIEESGANILNLAFGFLEWREAEHSDKSSHAPLLLIPVTLQKSKALDSKTRRERYRLEYSGEDIQPNLSLRERLQRDFSLILPELEDESEPEQYFKNCGALLTGNPNWAIHRFVTLGFFQFGKLLMYLDLDPDRWPEEKPISDHELIKQVLEGATDDYSGGAKPVDIDQLALDQPEAQIVEPADSSQHHAIIDAAGGRNMVIEGPPGTGKSQTITNIIGVCLAQEKSVLFVSEKLAALEVVKSRLEGAGLGDFCLELHSHKTQKRKFLDGLEKRTKRRSRAPMAGESKDNRKTYESVRSQIAEYLKAIGIPVDGYDMNRQQLFCEVARLGSLLPDDLCVDQKAQSPDEKTQVLNRSERQAAINLAAGADQLRVAVQSKYNELRGHPWYGLIPAHAETTKRNAYPALASWLESSSAVERHAFGPDAATQTTELKTPRDLERGFQLFKLLTTTICETFDISKVASSEARKSPLTSWLELERHLAEMFRGAASTWKLQGDNLPRVMSDIEATVGLLDTNGQALSRKTAESVYELTQCLVQLDEQIEEVASGALAIEDALSCRLDGGNAGILVTKQLLELSAQRPLSSLFIRQPILEGIKDLDVLTGLIEEHKRLVQERAKLSLQFKLDDDFDEHRLEAATSILANAKGLFRFQSEWRSANNAYQEIRHKRSFFRPTARRANDLRDLLHYRTTKKEFEKNSQHMALLGSLFTGLDTKVDDIWQIVTWYQTIRDNLGDGPNWKGVAAQNLMRLPEEAFAPLDGLASTPIVSSGELASRLLEQLDGLESSVGIKLFSHGWAKAAQNSHGVRECLSRASDLIARHCRDVRVKIKDGLEKLQAVMSLQDHPRRQSIHGVYLKNPVPGVWSDELIQLLDQLVRFAAEVGRLDKSSVLRVACVEHSISTPDLREKVAEAGRTYDEFVNARREIDAVFYVDELKLFSGAQESMGFGDITGRLERAQVSADASEDWIEMAKALESLRKVTPIPSWASDILFNTESEEDGFTNSVRFVTLAEIARREVEDEPVLTRFSSQCHNELLDKFRDLDDRLRRVSSRDIGNKLLHRPVPAGQTGRRVGDLTEMALLRHEMGKQKRHVPIRKLINRAGSALIGLKPCFMMGPLSVSQYLPPGDISFDLVIMDEASQMRPEDALGAIARGKQLIVVGDPKQLPPTSFFDRLNKSDEDDDEDEELTFGSQESILDIAAPLFGSSRTLNWHYRSQHEDLIAFSNHSFYESRLLLFPTAHAASEHLGITYRRVEGSYSNQTNEAEAQELITDVVREIKSGRQRSIGIVAINSKQAQVLRDIWDRNLREMPEIEELLAGDQEDEDVLDSLFIKNLENVQGDERDVIFISLTYGRDPNGNFYQRFGPINRDNGWRRLNVLFTRARQQMNIYSSMDSSMVVPGEHSSRGVIALKEFLSYCETGILPETPNQTGRGPDSPFEADVAAEVEAFGLKAEFQVGVAGFFIDIGVYDPREPRHFLLGVECDGATYHSSQSARDRDKIRQEVLENLGWNIYRIWSTDWFQHRTAEREKLRSALQVARLEADSREENRVADIDLECDESIIEAVPNEDSEVTIPETVVVSESDTEALKSRLLDLRRLLEDEYPDVRAEHSLLCDDVLDSLLRHRPTTLEEFHRSVPLEQRQKIDMEQSQAYLSTVMLMMDGG